MLGWVLLCWVEWVDKGWTVGWFDRMDGRLTDPRAQHAFSNLQILALPLFPPRTPSLPSPLLLLLLQGLAQTQYHLLMPSQQKASPSLQTA